MRALFEIHELIAALKRLPRGGWRERGVPDPESVAAHSYGVALLTLLLAEDARDSGSSIEVAAAVRMALIHDLAEAMTGDLTPRRRRALFGPDEAQAKGRQRDAEDRSLEAIFTALPPDSARRWRRDWERYRDQSSEEARLVARADRLDCVLQALRYREEGGGATLSEFHHLLEGIEDRQLLATLELSWATRGEARPLFRTVSPTAPADAPYYAGERRLRFRELRLPLGMAFGEEYVAGEESALHLVAVLQEEVVACLLFRREESGEGRLFQMAVAAPWQRSGLGRALLREMEARLARDGVTSLKLHARHYAITFYEGLGYRAQGEPFMEVGLPHRLMRKELT